MSVTIRWWISVILLVAPVIFVETWLSTDERGSYIQRKRVVKISWLYFWIILFYFLSLANMIHLQVTYYRVYGYDETWFNWWALIAWMLGAAVLMFYPAMKLKNTRLEGRELDMWEHLSVRREVLFPWEYNPVASGLAILFFLCSLLLVCTGVFIIAQYRYIQRPVDLILTVGMFAVGCYLCYLLFKPQTT